MKVKQEHHWKLSDAQFEADFADGSLPLPWFTHQAHIRLAWIQIKNYGVEQATENIRKQIIQFATAAGQPNKYHETITIASILMVAHFMKGDDAANSEAFIKAHPSLQQDFKELIKSHYSQDIFSDPNARKIFIEPDLAPFD